MPEIQCPNCREVLDVPAELANSPVRCGTCQSVVEPGSAPAVRRVEPSQRNEYREPASNSEDLPTPKKSLRWLWMLLVVGGLSCVGCCGLFAWLAYKVGNPTWTKYTSDDGSFSVDFPGDSPKEKSISIPIPGNKPVEMELRISERRLAQERYAVGVCDLPKVKIDGPMGKLLAEMYIQSCLNVLKNQPGVTVKETGIKDITIFDKPGKEYTGTFSDSTIKRGTVTRRVFVLNNKLYMLSAMGKDSGPPAERVEQFFSSFAPADGNK